MSAVVRAGFKQFLEADPSINAVGEAASGNETLDQLRRQDWDLLIMDIHMPDRSGLDILGQVIAGYPNLRVLIMSGLPEEQYARNVLRAGASGFLSKNADDGELCRAIRAAMRRAGHSVWFSGLVASLGLFALIVIPNSVVRGIGISGLFIPSTATLVRSAFADHMRHLGRIPGTVGYTAKGINRVRRSSRKLSPEI